MIELDHGNQVVPCGQACVFDGEGKGNIDGHQRAVLNLRMKKSDGRQQRYDEYDAKSFHRISPKDVP
jgi:hypothetical protein